MANNILTPDPQALAEEAVAEPVVHHKPVGFSDRFALRLHQAAALRRRHLLRQALRPPRHRAGNRRRRARHGRRHDQPPHCASPHVRRRRLDPHPDGGGRERAHAPDDLRADRPAQPVRAPGDHPGAVGLLHRLLPALPGLHAHRAPRRRLLRGRGGDQLHPLSEGDRRGPLAQRRRPPPSPGTTGRCPTTRRCAMSSSWFAPTKLITATSTTGSPARSPDCPIDPVRCALSAPRLRHSSGC